MLKNMLFVVAVFFLSSQDLISASFIGLKGQVSVKKSGTENWLDANKKIRLDVMDEVKTGDKSSAEIELVKGFRLNLGPNTVMAIRDQGVLQEKGIFLSVMLYMGEIFSSIKKMVVGKVELHTPTSVIGVRGTQFYSRVMPSGTSSLEVKDGIVDFNSVKENSRLYSINKGETAVVDFDLSVKVFKNKKEWDLFIKSVEENFKQKPELKLSMLDSVLDQMLKEITVMNAEYTSMTKEIELLTMKKKDAMATGDTNTAIQYNDKIYSKSFALHNVDRQMKHIQLRSRGVKYLLNGTNALPVTIDKMLKIESMVNYRGVNNEVK
jgi:hypothetical protein